MKRYVILIVLLFLIQGINLAQSPRLVNLWHELANSSQDTSRVLLMVQLSNYYKFIKPDSALYYGNSGIALAREINFPIGETGAMSYMVVAHESLGNYTNALKINLQALKIAEKNKLIHIKAGLILTMGTTYKLSKNYDQALKFLKESKMLYDSFQNDHMSIISQTYIGETYLMVNQLDSALYYAQLAYDQAVSREDVYVQYFVLPILAQIQHRRGNTELALSYFWHAMSISSTEYDFLNPNLSIARLYQQMDQPDSSIYYAKRSLEIAQESGFYSSVIDASILLSEIYEKRDLQKAFQFNKLALAYKDSLDYLRSSTAMETFIDFDEQERQYELETVKTSYQNQRIWIFSIAGTLISAVILAFVLYRNNRNKQKDNVKLKEQKEEIQVTLEKLESTQTQLIQSEKMASLGELTAGIAHEIQNPLNFVNNFSEVNKELILIGCFDSF